jgi:hypothetical protein
MTTEATHEEWTYLGRRLNANRTLQAVWRDPDGTDRWYPVKHAGQVIGGTYRVKIQQNTGGSVSLYLDPEYLDRDVPAEAAEWQLADITAVARTKSLASERRTAKRDALDLALDPLLDLARDLRTGAERDVFAAYILRQVNASWTRAGGTTNLEV